MILVVGNVAVTRIPVDILPAFKAPAVQVLTYFQGMPASSIEKTITNRIERWVNQSPGVERIESRSVPGVSVVKLYFRDDIDPNAALTMTTSLAQGTLPTLPPNTLPPVTLPFDPTGTLPLGILTVSNKELDAAHLKDVARIDVRNMLGAVTGCVAPVVVGGKDRTVLVYLRPKDMEVRNVSPLDVVHALQKGNQMVTPGIAYFGKDQILLDTNVMVEKIDELNDFPIRTVPGDRVYLKDIGHAEDAYTIQTSRVRLVDESSPTGRREVYVPIYRQQGASSLAVANGVKDHIAFMEQQLPPGTTLHFVMDQSLYVKEAIHSLIEEGIIGAILVSAMILVFLGNWRMTLIASMSIPLAILSAIIGLYATGNTINAMTLGGLALAIGEYPSPSQPGQVALQGGLRRRGRGDDSGLGGHFDHDHRALSHRFDARHGRLPVQAADARRGLRHDCFVYPVPHICPNALRQVVGRPRPLGRRPRFRWLGCEHPSSHRERLEYRHPAV
jgi:multidrug efflux pump subunit AcrB